MDNANPNKLDNRLNALLIAAGVLFLVGADIQTWHERSQAAAPAAVMLAASASTSTPVHVADLGTKTGATR